MMETGKIDNAAKGICFDADKGGYKGISLVPIEIIDDENSVDKRIGELFEKIERARTIEGRLERGDFVTFSYEGVVEEGPQIRLHGRLEEVELGCGALLDDLDAALMEHASGDVFAVEVLFPHDCVSEDLCGARASLTVTVERAFRVGRRAIDDDYVREVSDFSGLEHLRAAVREELFAQNRREEYRALSIQVEQALFELGEDVSISSDLVSERMALLDSEAYDSQLFLSKAVIANPSDSVSAEGQADLETQAKRALTIEAVANEIARVEGIEVSQAEIEGIVREAADAACVEFDEACAQLKGENMEHALAQAMLKEKVIDFVISNARFEEIAVEE